MDLEDEREEVFVRLLVTYYTEAYPGFAFHALQEFVDHAPDFEAQHGIMESYRDLGDCYFDLLHLPMPLTEIPRENHPGNMTIH